MLLNVFILYACSTFVFSMMKAWPTQLERHALGRLLYLALIETGTSNLSLWMVVYVPYNVWSAIIFMCCLQYFRKAWIVCKCDVNDKLMIIGCYLS